MSPCRERQFRVDRPAVVDKADKSRPAVALAQEFGQEVGSGRIVIHQKIGQRDLAAMAGIARESVNRILSDWRRRKLISRASGYYWIEDKAQLQNEAAL